LSSLGDTSLQQLVDWQPFRLGSLRRGVCVTLLLLSFANAHAQADRSAEAPSSGTQTRSKCYPTSPAANRPSLPEEGGLGGSIVLDEHLLTNGSRDEDYDGGGEVTLSGHRAGLVGRTLDRALGIIDQSTCPRHRYTDGDWRATHAFAAGILVFSPNDLAAHGIVRGDRPYASLFFLSAGRRYIRPTADVVYDSTFTVGILGLAATADVQRALHRLTGSTKPEGWSHQISSGGEPTARYNFARQALLNEGGGGVWHGDAKWTSAVSVGTVTEGSLALSTRWGRIESPWWSFAPEENMYVRETQPVAPRPQPESGDEVFAFAGLRAKLRVYNAFLQGQFRHSDLTYSEGDLNQLLGEAWAGIELRTSSGWAVQYLARWQSPELRSGVGSRSILWGSVEVSKSFN